MKPTLLCLHGWGGSKASFDQLRTELSGLDIEILTPDLPGFGSQADPSKPWTVDHYAGWVTGYVTTERKNNGPLWILGHSHGGRTAIVLASKEVLPIERLFLCAPAINRNRRYLLRRTIGFAIAKIGKLVFSFPGISHFVVPARTLLYKLLHVHDYERASPIMQKTLVLVTKHDLSPLLSSITQHVDLFWGEQDSQTPVNDAYHMQRLLPHCELHVYPNTRHGVHRDNARDIAAVIRRRCSSVQE